MKLLRFGEEGAERPGIELTDGTRIDAGGFGMDWDEAFFADPNHLDRLGEWVQTEAERAPRIEPGMRLGPCVKRPGKLIAIGLNFSDHAAEAGMKPPAEPIIFFKATSAICGPNDPLILPPGSEKTDWEVELAFVVGKRANYVSEAEAPNHVAGYLLHNDYSERSYQLERGGQWVKGKSCDRFAPIGPWVVTPDEIDDVHDLDMWLRVNGAVKQQGSTSRMIFSVPALVSYLSHFMSLMPGDIVTTGTPPGVGMASDPPQFLRAGDVVELGIEGLGESRQVVVSHES